MTSPTPTPGPGASPRVRDCASKASRSKGRQRGGGPSCLSGPTEYNGNETSTNDNIQPSLHVWSDASRRPQSASPVLSEALFTASRVKDSDRGWDIRRRDPRANGADIYVARFTKNGMGSAQPCWRCLEWCRWAGVKRVFHWDAEAGKFEVVKVNSARDGQYETHADIRLFAMLVRNLDCTKAHRVLIIVQGQ